MCVGHCPGKPGILTRSAYSVDNWIFHGQAHGRWSFTVVGGLELLELTIKSKTNQ